MRFGLLKQTESL